MNDHTKLSEACDRISEIHSVIVQYIDATVKSLDDNKKEIDVGTEREPTTKILTELQDRIEHEDLLDLPSETFIPRFALAALGQPAKGENPFGDVVSFVEGSKGRNMNQFRTVCYVVKHLHCRDPSEGTAEKAEPKAKLNYLSAVLPLFYWTISRASQLKTDFIPINGDFKAAMADSVMARWEEPIRNSIEQMPSVSAAADRRKYQELAYFCSELDYGLQFAASFRARALRGIDQEAKGALLAQVKAEDEADRTASVADFVECCNRLSGAGYLTSQRLFASSAAAGRSVKN